jgi:hypothetical protein
LEFIGIFLTTFGFIIGVVNWPISIRRITYKSGASGVPLVGCIFMLLGILLMPSGNLINLMWLAPIVDFTCVPLWVYAVFIKEKN